MSHGLLFLRDDVASGPRAARQHVAIAVGSRSLPPRKPSLGVAAATRSVRGRRGRPRLLRLMALRLLVASAHEHHMGHEAVHSTILWRRAAPTPRGHYADSPLHSSAEGAVRILSRTEDGGVIANITTELQDMKSEYTGEIGVGTRPDGGALFKAKVVFDTGSTNLWVASVLCQNAPCDDGRNIRFYDPGRSTSRQPPHDRASGDIDIMFGTGELKGPLQVDTYRVGPMVVKEQTFAMIREMTGEVFSSFQFEGILGLAFKSLSFGGISPFFERVIEQRLLKSNEFAFYLNSDSSKPSALLWGGVDKDLYEGPITLFPVVQPHYWTLELVEFRIGDEVLGGSEVEGSNLAKLIIDSGTTYFTVPESLHGRVLSHMPEAACADVEKYRPLVYVLRGVHGERFELVVTQETYMIGVANDENACRPAFMPLDVNAKYGPALILGEVFMRHFFTVFARGDGSPEQARVGFAAAKIGAPVQVPAHPAGPGPKQALVPSLATAAFPSGQALTQRGAEVTLTRLGGASARRSRAAQAASRFAARRVVSLWTPPGSRRLAGLRPWSLRVGEADATEADTAKSVAPSSVSTPQGAARYRRQVLEEHRRPGAETPRGSSLLRRALP